MLSFTKISVSRAFRSYLSYGNLTINTRNNKVDLAAELRIPNVPRGEPGSTKGISIIANLESKRAEELLGMTPVTPLKDVVAESVEDFKARGYPGLVSH